MLVFLNYLRTFILDNFWFFDFWEFIVINKKFNLNYFIIFKNNYNGTFFFGLNSFNLYFFRFVIFEFIWIKPLLISNFILKNFNDFSDIYNYYLLERQGFFFNFSFFFNIYDLFLEKYVFDLIRFISLKNYIVLELYKYVYLFYYLIFTNLLYFYYFFVWIISLLELSSYSTIFCKSTFYFNYFYSKLYVSSLDIFIFKINSFFYNYNFFQSKPLEYLIRSGLSENIKYSFDSNGRKFFYFILLIQKLIFLYKEMLLDSHKFIYYFFFI